MRNIHVSYCRSKNSWVGVIMSEQQFQAEVMDELKQQHMMQEALKQAYIDGWTKGMEDAAEMLKLGDENVLLA